jgi:hypothetical protein
MSLGQRLHKERNERKKMKDGRKKSMVYYLQDTEKEKVRKSAEGLIMQDLGRCM